MPHSPLHAPLLAWYAVSARALPWRASEVSAWGVLVSEVMLQQTPVRRVLPAYRDWLARWPTPLALAVSPTGDAVRQWGRLGYPRRALRLHAAAVAISDRHAGAVPSRLQDLRRLPGVGEYTAAAVAAFAFSERHPVLDTNVRRVLARVVGATANASGRLAVPERQRAERILPDEPATAARWGVAVMELGALVCTARGHRAAGSARFATGAAGAGLGGRRHPGPRGGHRPTPALTASAGAGFSPCCARAWTRCRRRPCARPGMTERSARGRWTAWWRTRSSCP